MPPKGKAKGKKGGSNTPAPPPKDQLLGLPDELVLHVADWLLEEQWEKEQKYGALKQPFKGLIEYKPVSKYDDARNTLRPLYLASKRLHGALEKALWHSLYVQKPTDNKLKKLVDKLAFHGHHVKTLRLGSWDPDALQTILEHCGNVTSVALSTGASLTGWHWRSLEPLDTLSLSQSMEVLRQQLHGKLESLQLYGVRVLYFGLEVKWERIWSSMAPLAIMPASSFANLRCLNIALVPFHPVYSGAYDDDDDGDEIASRWLARYTAYVATQLQVIVSCKHLVKLTLSVDRWNSALSQALDDLKRWPSTLVDLHLSWRCSALPEDEGTMSPFLLFAYLDEHLEHITFTVPADFTLTPEHVDEIENTFDPDSVDFARLRSFTLVDESWDALLLYLNLSWFRNSPLERIIAFDQGGEDWFDWVTAAEDDEDEDEGKKDDRSRQFLARIFETASLIEERAPANGGALKEFEVHTAMSHKEPDDLFAPFAGATQKTFNGLVRMPSKALGVDCKLVIHP